VGIHRHKPAVATLVYRERPLRLLAGADPSEVRAMQRVLLHALKAPRAATFSRGQRVSHPTRFGRTVAIRTRRH
jgi:hypothetical protein